MTNELARRIAITIGALLVYRLGTHIPVTGVWTSMGALPPGAFARLSIFSLGLIPYLSAAIFIRLLSLVWKRLSAIERSSERGRTSIARYTLLLTLLLTTFQAWGIATAIQRIPEIAADSGGWFVLSTAVSMTGGVFFLIWLSEQITRRGIGNGLALILSVAIIPDLPGELAAILDLVRRGAVSSNLVLGHAALWIAMVVLIVVVESARRNVPVQFAERRVGERVLLSRAVVLPIKINSAGYLVPSTVGPWLIYLPLAFADWIFTADTPWLNAVYLHLHYGRPAHLIVGSLAVFVLAIVYTAFVVDPDNAAESLARQGGVIPGVMPGEATAEYLDRVVSSTTLLGAAYLTAISLIPEVFLAYGNGLDYKMGGGAALIVVCTILDIQTQVRDLSLTNPGGVRR
ncbi:MULTISPECIES: preprotein translocase subunit SecY [Bradyrhizobium]|uniref:preprotein translocase subunit SecY n=1 Tax=Bradyrhizobium TaxID=374 RepID=UPI0023EEB742|nr:preprotein translocase subunit SecY [Bradyrhizobium zhengyangense]